MSVCLQSNCLLTASDSSIYQYLVLTCLFPSRWQWRRSGSDTGDSDPYSCDTADTHSGDWYLLLPEEGQDEETAPSHAAVSPGPEDTGGYRPVSNDE